MPETISAREAQLRIEFEARCAEVQTNRAYYAGEHLGNEVGDSRMPVPEHDRTVAYSTQVQECVDYIADQLADGFQVSPDDEAVAEIVAGTLANSPDIATTDDADALAIVAPFQEALVGGDVCVHVQWDPVNAMPWLEFWQSDEVDFRFSQEDRFRLERVILHEVVWEEDEMGDLVEVVRHRIWQIDPATGLCVVLTEIDDVVLPERTITLPYSFIPWRLWRGLRRNMRNSRGTPIITRRVRQMADRYDATCQLSFVIARYNSHGNLAVIGDAALMQSQGDARYNKDVADVLTFPGGTGVTAVNLSTDAQMIHHQTSLLTDAMYQAFGITRLDSTTMEGLGNLSGYALEILNRKSGGTFARIARQLSRDIRSTLNVAVDIYAVQMSSEDSQVAPETAYPDRAMKIVLGAGYVADLITQRDDFTAGLVSRRWVLAQRGMSDDEIDEIEEQLADEQPAATAVTLSSGAAAVAGDQLGTLDAGAIGL